MAETIASKLFDDLSRRFGSDWRKYLPVTMRADDWYWLAFLAEKGYERLREEHKANTLGDMSMALSVASWHGNVEDLANSVANAREVKTRKRKA